MERPPPPPPFCLCWVSLALVCHSRSFFTLRNEPNRVSIGQWWPEVPLHRSLGEAGRDSRWRVKYLIREAVDSRAHTDNMFTVVPFPRPAYLCDIWWHWHWHSSQISSTATDRLIAVHTTSTRLDGALHTCGELGTGGLQGDKWMRYERHRMFLNSYFAVSSHPHVTQRWTASVRTFSYC